MYLVCVYVGDIMAVHYTTAAGYKELGTVIIRNILIVTDIYDMVMKLFRLEQTGIFAKNNAVL